MAALREQQQQHEDAPAQASVPTPVSEGLAAPAAALAAGSLSPAAVIALQRSAGNAAVAALLRERAAPPARGAGAAVAPAAVVARSPATAAPPAPAGPGSGGGIRDPHEDPGFKAMKGATKTAGEQTKAHQPAAVGAATAQGAAIAPGNDASSQAAAAQVDEMSKQQPGAFDRKAFIAAVKQAIDAATPKTLEEADNFKGSGKAGKVKDDVQGIVKGGKEGSEKDIKEKTQAPPDTSKATPKPVKPMENDEPGAPPRDVGAAGAMPKPRPAQETDLSSGPAEVDAKLAEADIIDGQIQKSNEPTFTGALEARDAAREHSAQAPVDYRSKEQDVLAKGRTEAEAAAGTELQGMHGARTQALTTVAGKKDETKTADEQKRAKVATDIEGIYERTKTDVTGILDALDGKVDAAFTTGEGTARAQFESHVQGRMDAYKEVRYAGIDGAARWGWDKVFGMPDEVNAFYEEGKQAYLTAMDGVIGEVADVVGAELGAARARIAQGRTDVQKYVAQLPEDLKEVGREAADKLESQFEQLSSDVDAKQNALVDTLAKKYVEARDALDARIEELRAANKGFVSKALDAVGGMVETILGLKNMLMGVLSRAADVIGDIIKDPIGFLGNLVSGVKAGLSSFVGNIATHLKDGLMGWLFGALGSAGITMPKALDLQGILDLVLQVLGLTWQNVRMRAAKVVGEPLMAKMERTVDVFKDFAAKGIAGAWQWIKDKIGDLEEMVLGQIKEFVTSKIIKAGITWIVSLLNPAAAFIKACKAIYDIIMWIVERGSQLMEFVNAVLDSIGAIAKGSIGAVVEKVEGALSKALPVAISFLASLLGLGGISEKIRSIIDTVRAPINKAIDVVVGGAVKTFKKLFAGPIAAAKRKYEKGKDYVKGKVQGAKDRLTGGDRGEEKAGDEPEQRDVEAPFAMRGQPHRLIARGGPKPRLEMHSTPASLVGTIQKLYDDLTKNKADDAAGAAVLRQEMIQEAFVLLQEAESLQAQKSIDEQQLNALAGRIGAFGGRFNLTELELAAARDAARARRKSQVDKPVLGLFEGIDVDNPPPGWQFTDTVRGQLVVTEIVDPVQGKGWISRSFHLNAATQKWVLSLRNADLDGLETWIPASVPLTSRGINLITYATLRQQKLLDVPPGDAPMDTSRPKIQRQKWGTIANKRTIFELAQLSGGNKVSQSELAPLIVQTHSWKYAVTALTQSRYELVPGTQEVTGPVAGPAQVRGLSWVVAWIHEAREALGGEATEEAAEEQVAARIKAEYPGVTLDSWTWAGFEIEADVKPLGAEETKS